MRTRLQKQKMDIHVKLLYALSKSSVIRVVGKVSIIDLLHHSVCIVFLVSNSPLVPASQEAVQDESKQSNRYHDYEYNYYEL